MSFLDALFSFLIRQAVLGCQQGLGEALAEHPLSAVGVDVGNARDEFRNRRLYREVIQGQQGE